MRSSGPRAVAGPESEAYLQVYSKPTAQELKPQAVAGPVEPAQGRGFDSGRVYQALAEHQVSDTWELRDLLRELHRWVGIFVFEFKLEIPDVALCVDRLRARMGHFRCDRNGFGLEDEIAINRRHISGIQFWEVLGTLLHELVHCWQNAHGKSGKGCYHNVQYRDKALELGLVVDGHGHQQYEPNSRFIRLLRKHGVKVPTIPALTPPPAGWSKLKLWICKCEPPFRVRVARSGFSATCNHCGHQYYQPNLEAKTDGQSRTQDTKTPWQDGEFVQDGMPRMLKSNQLQTVKQETTKHTNDTKRTASHDC